MVCVRERRELFPGKEKRCFGSAEKNYRVLFQLDFDKQTSVLSHLYRHSLSHTVSHPLQYTQCVHTASSTFTNHLTRWGCWVFQDIWALKKSLISVSSITNHKKGRKLWIPFTKVVFFLTPTNKRGIEATVNSMINLSHLGEDCWRLSLLFPNDQTLKFVFVFICLIITSISCCICGSIVPSDKTLTPPVAAPSSVVEAPLVQLLTPGFRQFHPSLPGRRSFTPPQ